MPSGRWAGRPAPPRSGRRHGPNRSPVDRVRSRHEVRRVERWRDKDQLQTAWTELRVPRHMGHPHRAARSAARSSVPCSIAEAQSVTTSNAA